MLQSTPARFTGAKPPSTRDFLSYGGDFVQKLVENGIFSPHEPPTVKPPQPRNLVQIRQILSQPRHACPLSPDEIAKLVAAANRMISNREASDLVVAHIKGTCDDAKPHSYAENVFFGGLRRLDKHVKLPRPSLYHGARPEQIHPSVYRELKPHIVPSDRPEHPVVPNFFLETGNPKDDLVAMRQATYYGTLGASAILHLQNYGQSPVSHDGNAYTISATVCNGMLALYATFPQSVPEGGGTEYYTIRLRRYDLCDEDTFIKGIDAYRNAREWARQVRDQWIMEANTMAESQSGLSRVSLGDSGSPMPE